MGTLLAKLDRKPRHFHAHETARFDALSGVQLASFRQRAWAIAIDVAVVLVVKSLLGMHSHHHSAEESGPLTMAKLLMEGVHSIEDLIESTLYFAIALKVSNGQTVGKWVMKARVVSLTHDSMGWWQSTERALGYGASLLEGGFGFVQFFINRNQQTVHDRIAETIVVDERPTARRLMHVEVEEPEVGLLADGRESSGA
jgi:RDD family